MCAPEVIIKADVELCATFRGEELQYGPNQFTTKEKDLLLVSATITSISYV
jgi:hypothetical protein